VTPTAVPPTASPIETISPTVLTKEDTVTSSCFSQNATAVVLGKGRVQMGNLAIGDSVLVAPGIYDYVYSIDHYSTDALVNYVVIHTANCKERALEVTARHMLYVSGKEDPVPAGSVTTNDYVMTLDGPARVLNISLVTRKGLVNPLTSTGRIVVDGILASTYSSFSESDSYIKILSYRLFSVHYLIHLAAVPYHRFCTSCGASASRICNEHPGLAWASQFFLRFSSFLFGRCAMVRLIIISAYVSLFGSMNFVILHPWMFVAIMMSFLGYKLIKNYFSLERKIKSE